MRKLIFIFALCLLGCEKEDVTCKCDLEVTIDGTNSYYVTGVETDCNGNYDRNNLPVPEDHFILGLRNCK